MVYREALRRVPRVLIFIGDGGGGGGGGGSSGKLLSEGILRFKYVLAGYMWKGFGHIQEKV